MSDEWWVTELWTVNCEWLLAKSMVCRFLGNGSISKLKLYHKNLWKNEKIMEGQKIHWGDLHQKFRKTKPVTEEGCGVVYRYEHGHSRTFSDSQGRPRTLTNTHAHSPQSTGHDSQSPAHSSQLTVQSPRSALRCSQLTTNSQLTAHSPQFTAHSPQPAAYSSQFTSHHSQLAVHNSHPAAHSPRPTNYSSQLTMNNPHSSHRTSNMRSLAKWFQATYIIDNLSALLMLSLTHCGFNGVKPDSYWSSYGWT